MAWKSPKIWSHDNFNWTNINL